MIRKTEHRARELIGRRSARTGCATATPTATAARTSASVRRWRPAPASRRSSAAATAPACLRSGGATAIPSAATCPTK